MPTVYVKNELGVRTPIQVSSRKYKDMVQSYYMSHPYVPGVGGGGGEQTGRSSGYGNNSGYVRPGPDVPFNDPGHGPGGDQSGVVGPENATMSTYDLAKIMTSIPLHMNPFTAVLNAGLNAYKGENALNMNSVPQTGLNLFARAIAQIPGLESFGQFGMDPASIPGMQAISNAHSINEAMAENGLNPNGSNIGGFDPGALGLANLGSGLDPGADQGDAEGIW